MIWTVAQTESLRERKAQRWLAQAEFETTQAHAVS
jgi:hypothetical protein